MSWSSLARFHWIGNEAANIHSLCHSNLITISAMCMSLDWSHYFFSLFIYETQPCAKMEPRRGAFYALLILDAQLQACTRALAHPLTTLLIRSRHPSTHFCWSQSRVSN